MQTTQPAYFTDYRSLRLTRDAEVVLVVEFHSNGGPLTFTGQDHTDFVEVFYRIAQDRANKIVILTGKGGEFIPGSTFRRSAMSPTRMSGARCTTRVFRFSRISQTFACL